MLRKLREVPVAGRPQNLHALFLQSVSQGANAQARGVLGAEVFVDDDDGESKFHPEYLSCLEVSPVRFEST